MGAPVTLSGYRVPRLVRVFLPVVYCHRCRSQVLVTDAAGRWSTPTFLGPLLSDARTLVCLWCALADPDPGSLVPVTSCMAAYVEGCAAPLSDREAFDLFVDLGASLGPEVEADSAPVARVADR